MDENKMVCPKCGSQLVKTGDFVGKFGRVAIGFLAVMILGGHYNGYC